MILKDLRNQKKISQQQLANNIGVSRSTVAMWENGNSQPDNEMLLKLSAYFSVSVDYLLGNTANNALRIPVLGTITAGIPLEAIEDIADYEEIPQEWARGGNEFFALKIKGDSMLPEYRSGDVIIFKKQNSCDNNEDCAVMVNGYDATFKRIEWLENGVILKPLNPSFETKFYSNEEIENLPVKIIGVFWELRRSRNRNLY